MVSGKYSETKTHTITQTDNTSVENTTVDAQTDKAGFLSFLGVGVTDNNSFQVTLVESTSAQTSIGQKFSSSYTLYSDPSKYYCTEIYFDVVFGSFAFRDVTSSCNTEALSGAAPPNQLVTATISGKRFVTTADSKGKFQLSLPSAVTGDVTLSSPNVPDLHVQYTGSPIANVDLVQH